MPQHPPHEDAARQPVQKHGERFSLGRLAATVGRSLKLKFTLIIIVLLALTVGLAPWGAIQMQEAQLLAASEQRLLAFQNMTEAMITTHMLTGDRNSIQEVVEATKGHRDIYRLRLLSPEGEIRFSSQPEEIGERLDPEMLSRQRDQPEPAVSQVGDTVTHSLTRSMNNGPKCVSCHEQRQETLGSFQISLSLDPMWEELSHLRRSALAATLITLTVIAVSIWLSLAILVDKPVRDLLDVMGRVETGDLTARTTIRSNDELGHLGRRLDKMISKLHTAQEELNEYHREQLARVDRLATLGEMAAVLAHEIRNPLTGIRGVLSVLAREFPEDHPRREAVRQTNQLIDRLNKSLEDLLHYSRPSHPELRSVKLDDIVCPALSLLEGEARKANVTLIAENSPGTATQTVLADPHQIQQVLVNLILNAIQATPSGGQIRVRTGCSRDHGEDNAVIEVQDDGKGMTTEEAQKAFHPFFSTKTQGTGLGLPIAKQIVEQHHGQISLTTNPGGGTHVKLTLPTSDTPASGA